MTKSAPSTNLALKVRFDGPVRRTSQKDQLDKPAGRMSQADQLGGPAIQTSQADQQDRSARLNSQTDQLDGSARQISQMDQLDRPVLYFRSFGQFAYSKIDPSVCTLLQLPSLMKALFLSCFLCSKACLCIFMIVLMRMPTLNVIHVTQNQSQLNQTFTCQGIIASSSLGYRAVQGDVYQ